MIAEATPSLLSLTAEQRAAIWHQVELAVERYIRGVDDLRSDRTVDRDAIAATIDGIVGDDARDPEEVLAEVLAAMDRYQTHTRHRRHFGLFETPAATMGIAAEALIAAYNPCLATWGGSPFGVEVERRLAVEFAARFGWTDEIGGVFTSGGSEANYTALATAVAGHFPAAAAHGVRSLPAQPVVYVTADTHPSVAKAARLCGLGDDAVHVVRLDGDQRLDPGDLVTQVERDRKAGEAPFFVAATAGTVGTGVIDPLADTAALAEELGLWFHVDAAWGGAVALVPELRPLLDGIDRADSITFDPHKWLSIPLGAGLALTRHPKAQRHAFDVEADFLVGDDSPDDPKAMSLQWARRFVGLKVLLPLAAAGWNGYEAVIREQVELGDRLRAGLVDAGWEILNRTPLPVVCFVDPSSPGSAEDVVAAVNSSGSARLYTSRVGSQPAIRACLTNYRTTAEDLDVLLAALDRARTSAGGRPDAQG